MVTTIQLNESVKKTLDRLKTERETYENVIVRIIEQIDKQKRKQEELLIEGCREMYSDLVNISKEWELTLMDGLDKNGK